MSDLKKLARKAKVENVKGHDITIKPLGMSDMDMFDTKDETPEGAKKLAKDLILKSIPGATEDEFNEMSIEYIIDLQEAIMKACNVDEEKIKEKAKVLADIKKEQDAKSA